MKKIIEVFVEKNSDGSYWGTSQNFEGLVTTSGESLEELQVNFKSAFADNLEIAKEFEEEYANDYNDVDFEYKMDLSSFFELVPELKISSIAKRANMNESLVRRYKSGKETVTEEQANKILNAIHDLGRELLTVKF